MKTIWFLVFRVFLVIAFLSSYLYFLYGQERDRYTPIARNAAYRDLVDQIALSVDDPAHDTLGNEVIVRRHQSEPSVGIYDLTVFKTIDQARVRRQKADRDLKQSGTSCLRKKRQIVGGDACRGKQSSIAMNADSQLSRKRALRA